MTVQRVTLFAANPFDPRLKTHKLKGTFIIHYTSEGEPVMLEILRAAQFLKETTDALPYPTVAKILATK